MKAEDRRKMSGVFRALGHPVRIMIAEKLAEKKRCVNDIKNIMKARQPNISQHLMILRMNGIVDYKQSGKKKCYFLVNPGLVKKVFKVLENAGFTQEPRIS